jgi:hypothetical protein
MKIVVPRKRFAFRFPVVKSPLYLIENLSSGHLPPVLWRWHVGLLSPKKRKKNNIVVPISRMEVK